MTVWAKFRGHGTVQITTSAGDSETWSIHKVRGRWVCITADNTASAADGRSDAVAEAARARFGYETIVEIMP